MKKIILSVMLVVSFSVAAQASEKAAPAKTPRKLAGKPGAIVPNACKLRVEDAIRRTVRLMGDRREIGFEIYDGVEAGKDTQGRALTEFASSVFHINDGYISNSGATVIVANAKAECVVIKMSVNLGVPQEQN